MKRQQINILCATDDNYVPYCGIMLTSVFINNRDADILVYVITIGLTIENSNKLLLLASQYGQKIEFVIADAETINFPIWEGDHISVSAYLRLFAADLLPDNVSKVLYLDCDIIVNKSLQELWNTDVSNVAAGVVIDSGHFSEDRNVMCGLDNAKHYFNSGVLLINVEMWRENQIWNQFSDFMNTHQDNLRSHDQDVLNAVLKGRVKYLPLIYNFQDFYLFSPYFNRYNDEFKRQVLEVKRDDVVVWHLSMPVKPLRCWHWAYPFDTIWKKYKKISLWKSFSIAQPWNELVNCLILNFCWKLGVKRNSMEFIKKW